MLIRFKSRIWFNPTPHTTTPTKRHTIWPVIPQGPGRRIITTLRIILTPRKANNPTPHTTSLPPPTPSTCHPAGIWSMHNCNVDSHFQLSYSQDNLHSRLHHFHFLLLTNDSISLGGQQPNNFSFKNINSGFIVLINSIFLFLDHFLISFSRAMQSRM